MLFNGNPQKKMSLINISKNCNICDCNHFLSYIILVFCNWRVSWLSSIEQAFKIKMSNNKTTYLLTTFLGCFWQMSDWIFFSCKKKKFLMWQFSLIQFCLSCHHHPPTYIEQEEGCHFDNWFFLDVDNFFSKIIFHISTQTCMWIVNIIH